jgi:hypothetical protein
MTALGMMEDHNRLLRSTESGSGPSNSALRDRGVLILSCVLVALGSLLCVGKESLAKQPDQTPKPGQAPSHQPTSPQPPNHQPAAAPNSNDRAPAAQTKPTPQEPADRSQSSRPTEQRPAEQRPAERTAPAGQRGPAQGSPAEPLGRQVAPHKRPVHEQRPAHGPKPTPESTGLHKSGRKPGPRNPVRPDPARQHPSPEKVERGHLPRPVHERRAPKTTPHPQGNENTGRQKGLESPGGHSRPASPPGREIVHPKGKSSVGPPEPSPQRPEHGMVAGPERSAGNGASKPVTPGKKSVVEKSPAHAGTPASVSDSRSPDMGTKVPPDHKAPARTLAGHKTGSETTPGANPSYRQAGTEGGISGPRSVGLRREEPARVAEPSPANVPDHGIVRSSQTAGPLLAREAVPAAPRGGMQSPAGEQIASKTPVGATTFLLDPLWDERSSLVDLSEEALRKASSDPKTLATVTHHRGSLTQRGPPLEMPQPFSGIVQIMGGAAFGSGASGNGAPQLLAVIVVCLVALLYQGWFRAFCASLRPGTVYRPVLERPG